MAQENSTQVNVVAGAAPDSVGTVADVTGHATITHMDGTKVDAIKGMAVFKGDLIETDEKGGVNITFEDNTVFAVSNNAQMTIDEFVYDPAKDGEGDADISVMRGIFAYTSGFVGKEDPTDVNIKTSAGSIGIRGTTLTGYIPPEGSGEEARISLIEGAIVVRPTGGGEFALDSPRETVEIDTTTGQGENVGLVAASDIMDSYNIVRNVAPALFDHLRPPAPVTAPPPANSDGTPADAAAPQGENNVPVAEDVGAEAAAPSPDGTAIAAPEGQLDSVSDADVEAAKTATTEGLTDDAGSTENVGLMDDGASLNLMGPPPSGERLLSPEMQMLLGMGPAGEGMLPPPPPPPLFFAPHMPPPPPGDTVNFTDTNRAPKNMVVSHGALDQPGLEGQTTFYNMHRFFYDPDGNPLSYKITGVTGGITGVHMSGSYLMFDSVASGVATIQVAAFDGKAYSGNVAFIFNVYGAVAPAGFSPTTSDDTESSYNESVKHFSLLAGNDTLNIMSGGANNIIYGGEGNDTLFIASTASMGNKIFGDAGNDTLKVGTSFASTLSGGMGDDTLEILNGSAHTTYGGDGNDIFALSSAAISSLSSGTGLFIDAGIGFDKLLIESSVSNLDLTGVGNDKLKAIEMIRYESLISPTSLTLDIADMLQHSDTNSLFISADGAVTGNNMSIIVANAGGLETLTNKGTMSTGGDTYNVYSNGHQTLYIDSDIANANITGAGISP